MVGGYGENTPTFTTTTTAPNAQEGTKAEDLSVANYVSGDAKLLPTFDLGGCSPSVTAGRTYSLRAWYKSNAVTQFAVYYPQRGRHLVLLDVEPVFRGVLHLHAGGLDDPRHSLGGHRPQLRPQPVQQRHC